MACCRSLTVQITLFTVAIVMVGIWSLSLYTEHMLRLDMQREMGSQQASVASYIAGNIDRELGIRLDALQQVSDNIQSQTQTRLQPLELQQLLTHLPVFQSLFNGGTFAVSLQGGVVAQSPVALQVATDDIARIQASANAGVAELIFLSDDDRVFMAVPLYTAQRQAVGAIVGIIRMDRPNFLETIKRSQYGKAGSYMLYSVAQKRVIAATQPPSGAPAHPVGHLLQHAQGTAVEGDHFGEEALVTDRPLARTAWNISIALPTEEAFAPVRTQQERLILATVAVSLLAGLASWWIVRRQLSALVRTANTLHTLAQFSEQTPHLPLTHQHETDQLITAFNQLLDMIRSRTETLVQTMELGQSTLDSVGLQIAVLDAGGQVVAINQPWQRFTTPPGATHAATVEVGCSYQMLFGQEKCSDEDSPYAALCQGIESVLNGCAAEFSIESSLCRMGCLYWFYTRATRLGDGHQGVVVARTDITPRKQADAQVRKLSQIAEQAPLSIVITDLQGHIEYTNPYFSEKTLFSAPEVLGKNPRILQSGETPPSVYQDLWQTLTAQRVWRGELHNRKKNGEVFIERTVIAPVLSPAGQVTHYVAVKEDVTHEKAAENHRFALSARVEELSRRLVRTQEEARLRFSQELHDRTSPNLAALRINLDIIANTVRKLGTPRGQSRGQDFADRIEDTRALIEDTNASIREICAGLHPAAIERGGLLGVVQSYATQFAKRTGIQTQVHCPHPGLALHPDLELALFRIFQEALTNCAKHAKATDVQVRMQFDGRPIFLSVTDNGQGFDNQHEHVLHGLGLISMRETVEFAGGVLRVESAPGLGTQIYVEI